MSKSDTNEFTGQKGCARFAVILALVGLCAVTFFVRFKMYSKSVHPTGLDGYYYALQAKSLMQNGVLENPDYEIGYYLCGIFGKVFGDAIIGVKVCDAVTSALTCAAVFALIFAATQNIWFSFLAFMLTAVSPCFTLMGINYINNQIGLMFLFFFVGALAGVLRLVIRANALHRFAKPALAVLLFLLCALSHKVTLVYSIFSLGIFCILISKNVFDKIQHKKWVMYLFAATTVIFAVGGFLFFKRHSPRFINSFSLWSLPLSKNKMFVMQMTKSGIIEIYFYYALAFVLAILFFVREKNVRARFCILCSVLFVFFPFWNPSSDMGLRMIQNAVADGIPLCVFLLWKILRVEDLTKKMRSVSGAILTFVSFALLFKIPFTEKLYNVRHDPPYEKYMQIAKQIELSDESLLIAHLGLNHVYTYYKNLRDCLNWNCDFEVPGDDIWRLAYGADRDRIIYILTTRGDLIAAEVCDQRDLDSQITQIYLHGKYASSDYILLKEDLWQKYLLLEDKEIAETFNNWYNPHEFRPGYIRRK